MNAVGVGKGVCVAVGALVGVVIGVEVAGSVVAVGGGLGSGVAGGGLAQATRTSTKDNSIGARTTISITSVLLSANLVNKGDTVIARSGLCDEAIFRLVMQLRCEEEDCFAKNARNDIRVDSRDSRKNSVVRCNPH